MTSPEPTYIVVGCRPWNRTVFEEEICRLAGRWHYFGEKSELTYEKVHQIQPRYVFFLHWSWIVPVSITGAFECVCFHMTDLPYGRGGSPLQNLIARGHKDTVITAFRMTEELDAGPIYLKGPLSLDGSAQEIYRRATEISTAMIARIVSDNPEPTPQTGVETTFSRRTPTQSLITPDISDLRQLHDHIRMLDAEGYPPAFISVGVFTFSFTRSSLEDDGIEATVKIKHEPKEE